MFTGIVAAVGRITSLSAAAVDAYATTAIDSSSNDGDKTGLHATIEGKALDLSDVVPGDSISVNGVCLTVVELGKHSFVVDISRETLSVTSGLDTLSEVNLEKAMRLSDRLGGHLVSGHVDGIGTVVAFEAVGESWRLVVSTPRSLCKFVATKGSIAVNGVSLTVNSVDDDTDGEGAGCRFSVNLIPHTLANTTLKQLAPGATVNLEIDQLARYVDRIISLDKQQ